MIDLRSDTVTKPSQGMKKAMYDAELGDDCYGDDPTINKLEYEMALLLGKDKAVFMTSGTQSNLSAVLSHCGRGEEMIAGSPYHMAQDEAAGASVLGGVAMTTIAAFIGAKGLGFNLKVALNSLKIGKAAEIGICVVIIAVVLDKLS